MAGVRTLADGRMKWMVLTAKPATPAALKVADLASAVNVGDKATKSGTYIRGAASDTSEATHFNSTVKGTALGQSNYAGQIEPYMYLDPTTGIPDATDNALYALFAVKGTTLYVFERRGPVESVANASGQPYVLYEVQVDSAQQPEQTGLMRDVFPLSVLNRWTGTLSV